MQTMDIKGQKVVEALDHRESGTWMTRRNQKISLNRVKPVVSRAFKRKGAV